MKALKIDVWKCTLCNHAYIKQDVAESCCSISYCKCGATLPNRDSLPGTLCSICELNREQELFSKRNKEWKDKAESRRSDDPLYSEVLDRFFTEIEELEEDIEEDELDPDDTAKIAEHYRIYICKEETPSAFELSEWCYHCLAEGEDMPEGHEEVSQTVNKWIVAQRWGYLPTRIPWNGK